MYNIDTFRYEYYTLAGFSPAVPFISVDTNTATMQEIQDAVDAYLSSDGQTGAAVEYRDAYLSMIGMADYIRDRFFKDLTEAMVVSAGGTTARLSTIDPVNNTFTPNIKADDIFNEAMRGADYSSESSLAAAGINCERIFTDIFLTDDRSAIIYSEPGETVTYDSRAQTATFDDSTYTLTEDDYAVDGRTYYTYRNGYYVAVDTEPGDSLGDPYYERTSTEVSRLFVTGIPNATGTGRVFYAYEAAEGDYVATFIMKYDPDEELWFIASYDAASGSIGPRLAVCDDIDVPDPEWRQVG